MRKITIIAIIILVVAAIGGTIFLAMGMKDITYVADYTTEISDQTQYMLHRLYSSNIDQAKIEELISKTHSTFFTDEDIEKAALLAGTPQFYPTLCLDMDMTDKTDYNLVMNGLLVTALAPGQTVSNYSIRNLTVEIVTTGLTMVEGSAFSATDANGETKIVYPVISIDGTNLAAFPSDCCSFNVYLSGYSGRVMLQLTYDVAIQGPFTSHTVLEDQMLIVNVDITVNENGDYVYNFTNEAGIYQVSDLY